MSKFVGIWLDRRGATIVALEGESVETHRIESGVEPRLRLAGGARSKVPFGPQDIADEHKSGKRRRHQLARYYRSIITTLRDADAVLLMGPAEAPRELGAVISRTPGLRPKLREIRSCDKLTQKQLVARVREFFGSE
jgi:hypothetical protein